MNQTEQRMYMNCQIKNRELQAENDGLRQQNDRLQKELYKARLKVGGGGAEVDEIIELAAEERQTLMAHIAQLEHRLKWFRPHNIPVPIDNDLANQLVAEVGEAGIVEVTMESAAVIEVIVYVQRGSDCYGLYFGPHLFPGTNEEIDNEFDATINSLCRRSPELQQIKRSGLDYVPDDKLKMAFDIVAPIYQNSSVTESKLDLIIEQTFHKYILPYEREKSDLDESEIRAAWGRSIRLTLGKLPETARRGTGMRKRKAGRR